MLFRKHAARPSLANLLTILLTNQEPLLAMAFPEQQGWPFPAYYGACGRLAVFTDAGGPVGAGPTTAR